MRRKTGVICALCLGVIFAVSAAWAQTALLPGKSSPQEVVLTRKFAMRSMNADLRDIRLKLEKGDVIHVVSPTLSIAAKAQMLPLVFEHRYESVYPVEGSDKYFKGADPAKFQAAAEYLNAQAQKFLRIASDNDLKKAEQHLNRVKKACRSCHRENRGEN
jgi:cytochrome c556